MKQPERFPIFIELLNIAYRGDQKLITRSKNALNWSPSGRYTLFDMAADEVIVAALYLFNKKDFYQFRNLGAATIERLYDFMHSEAGELFFKERGLDQKEIQINARRMIAKEYSGYNF